ncbi:DUF3822 family protein [uncultured Flavobacterium sp.]|jgi:hypothetical protein|uniref:DUF3822 family protein n=1 Tax=uncultured Flavobacterium sp. TaxID=165435 RepID=UPI0025971BB7|nr:DUF3822 family protein [uncultured Flavobacterium sp.]
MVISSSDITQKTYKKLVIQVALNTFSFCVFDLITNKVLHTQALNLEKNKVIEEQLWRAFVDYPILTKNYDEVVVLHNNNLNAFVPSSLFDPHFLASYLQYNTKIFETDFFAYDVITPYEINNVYVPFMNINNFLLDQFESFDYKNSNSILVKKCIDFSKNKEEKQVFVHIQKEHFEIVVVRNQELILFNSFHYSTAEDFIYYLLFTCEQLQLNPETINVQLFGDCVADDANFKIAYTYIRNCSLLDVSHLTNGFDATENAIRNHFTLYHS